MASNLKKVLVVGGIGQAGLDILNARDDVEVEVLRDVTPEAYASALEDAEAVTLGGTPLKAEHIAGAPRLKVACRIGVGFDAVDVNALTERGIPLAVTGTANSPSVAEQAFAMMLSLAKQGLRYDSAIKDGNYRVRGEHPAFDLNGKNILVVGFGRIGSRTATRAVAFEMHVYVCDPYIDQQLIEDAGCTSVADIHDVLPDMDFVTIHVPRNEETYGMFGAKEFASMKESAYIVNTARGGLIDEAALYEELRKGGLAGAGLDVFDPEPPEPDNPLLKLDNVIVSPHTAGVSVEAGARMSAQTARNALAGIDGTLEAEFVVNAEVLD